MTTRSNGGSGGGGQGGTSTAGLINGLPGTDGRGGGGGGAANASDYVGGVGGDGGDGVVVVRYPIAPTPEIDVRGNGTSIADGDATPSAADDTDFGLAFVPGDTVVRTFIITNTGNQDLTITGVSVGGGDAADFTVDTTGMLGTLAGGAGTSFRATFVPSTNGVRTTTLTISNSDADEATYDFLLRGEGTTPVVATGGSITNTLDGYRIHTFASSGTLDVFSGGYVDLLVVGGGGGGGSAGAAGGGGGGGVLYTNGYALASGSYAVTVGVGGAGGVSGSAQGKNGSNSVFAVWTALGGGGGSYAKGNDGGCGGGSGRGASSTTVRGLGTAGQGYAGGTAGYYSGQYPASGGGGAGGPGVSVMSPSPGASGAGGIGFACAISGTQQRYGGGGGGGGDLFGGRNLAGAAGGAGGGGNGSSDNAGSNGLPNTGGGGGGCGQNAAGANGFNGGNGGSGVVMVRYRFADTYPAVANLAASAVGAVSAQLNAEVTSTGATETAVWVYYGPTDGQNVKSAWWATNALGPRAKGPASVTVSNLLEETTYLYRFSVSNAEGEAWCPVATSFTTGWSDGDGDGLRDRWENAYGGTNLFTRGGDWDRDGLKDEDEYTAGTVPSDPVSAFRFTTIQGSGSLHSMTFDGASGRHYAVEYADEAVTSGWYTVLGSTMGPVAGGPVSVTDSNSVGTRFYRGRVALAPIETRAKELPILISTWNSVNDPSVGTAMYKVDPDGGEMTEITVPANDRSFGPWWSNDRKWIYYQAKIAGQYPTARCRPDGSEHAVFTVGLGPMAATTNLMADNRNGYIGVSDPDGSNYRNLVGGNSYMQSISADGRKVIYSTFGSYSMNCVDVATKAVVTLANPTATMGQPSPDNQWVVFTRGVNSDVFRVPLAGGAVEQLTSGAGSHNWYWYSGDTHGSSDPPKISPDGSTIVYGAKVGGVDQVWVMDINGANKRQLTSLPGACGRRHWNTRGDRIAFISWVGVNAQVFVVDLKPGSTPVQLTHFTGNMKAAMLTWAPSNGLY